MEWYVGINRTCYFQKNVNSYQISINEMSTILKSNLEQILVYTNRYVNIKPYCKKYSKHFHSFKNEVFKRLQGSKVFGSLYAGYQIGGE